MALSVADIVEVPGPWAHRYVAANGARFHVAAVGDGPLVLFLHGFPEFWWAFRHQLPAVAAAGFTAVAMDLRGYGGSDKTPRGYDPATLAADVDGVIRSLGHSRAALVGHGWGGYVGWAAAVLHAERVAGLVAVAAPHPLRMRAVSVRSAAQLRRSGRLWAAQLPLLPERLLRRNDGAAVGRLLRAWAAPGGAFPDAESASRYAAAIGIWPAPHCALEYDRWLVRSVLRRDGRRFATAMRTPVRCPVLQLHGAVDPVVLLDSARGSDPFVAAPCRLVTLDGVGHFPHEEAPDRSTAELLSWLAASRGYGNPSV